MEKSFKPLFQDYETYYGPASKADGTTLSLSLRNPKLSMTDYVRHPEFEVHGVSLWFDNMKAPEWFKVHELRGVYKDIDWKSYRVIAHNAIFEALINWECFRIVPGKYFCTMALTEAIFQGQLARGLGYVCEKLGIGVKLPDLVKFKGIHTRDFTPEQWDTIGAYANNDTWLAAKVFQLLGPLLPDVEWEVMSQAVMMFGRPLLLVDVPLAREALAEAIAERQDALAATKIIVPEKRTLEEEISGNISFAKHLGEALGGPIPMKEGKKGPIPAFAKTDGAFIGLQAHADERVRNLVKARLMVKGTLPITRAQRLIDVGTQGSAKLPVCIHYARAHTMRDSGGNKMNMQNLKRGSKLRRAIRAPEGYVIGVADSRQIEPRWLTTGVKQMDVVKIFQDPNGDPYSYQASAAYGFTVTKKTHPIERQVGKVMQLSLGYQTGPPKLFNTLNIREGIPVTFDFCIKTVRAFREQNAQVSGHWKMWDKEWLPHLVNGLKKLDILDGLMTLDPQNARIIFPNGCYLKYPGLECEDGSFRYWSMKSEKKRDWRNVYGGAMTENWVQAISRHTVLGFHAPIIGERFPIVLRNHDELGFLMRESEADEGLAWAMEIMRTKAPWMPAALPLDVEGGYDVSYSK